MGYYCGIDLGDKITSIEIINKDRKVIAVCEIRTNAGGYAKFFKKYRSLTCIVEASPLAEWACREVEKYGHKITIVCARKTKAALSGHSMKKTDKRDAKGLAELCRTGWYEAVHRKSEEAREMRSFMTARKQLVETSTALSSCIRGLLKAHGVKLEKGDSEERDFASKVKKAMKQLPRLARRGIEELLVAFLQVYKQQRELYKELNKEAKRDAVTDMLRTVPGVGPATASAFVATIDDPNRFTAAEKVGAYLGLVPRVYQSGDTEYRGRITKTGDQLLRWLLVESAHILLSRSSASCDLKRWGLELEKKKGIGKARVAVARRLAGIMWKMWKDQQTFNPEACAA